MTHTRKYEWMDEWRSNIEEEGEQTEQKNGVKTGSSDFLIIDRKKREKRK